MSEAKPKRLVIYHANCFDGWCARWLFENAFPQAEFVAAQYGEPPPAVRGKHVTVVDFSYTHDLMKQMVADTNGEFVVLDHHATAEPELAGLEGHYVFDKSKSGARLAWEFLWDNGLLPPTFGAGYAYAREKPPWLVAYTEDRDLWQWRLAHSREVNAALRSYPLTFDDWNWLKTQHPTNFVVEGQAILRVEAQVVERHVRNAREEEIGGFKVLTVNATTLHSEIAGELAKNRPFGVCFFVRADGTVVYSLRSEKGGVDVAEVARRFGGGGHPNAAGFQVGGWLGQGRTAA